MPLSASSKSQVSSGDNIKLEPRRGLSDYSKSISSPISPVSELPHVPRKDSNISAGQRKIQAPEHNRIFSLQTYRSLSWIFGFREKYSLLLFIICGGGLLGYCLSRAYFMNGSIMRSIMTAGEFRWFNLSLYRINFILHIYLSIVGGLFVGPQFLPAIRRNYILLHRMNGYACLGMLIPANVCGAIVARRAVGGEINDQSAYYLMAIMLIFSALMGYYYVKRDTRKHRKWMLRFVVYFSTVITGHLLVAIAQPIITDIGSYYSLWRCDEVFFVLQNTTVLQQMFPQCPEASSNPTDNGLYVAVHASDNEGQLGAASTVRVAQGMCLWIALVIHVAFVEIYIRLSESSNYDRRGFVLEPGEFEYLESRSHAGD